MYLRAVVMSVVCLGVYFWGEGEASAIAGSESIQSAPCKGAYRITCGKPLWQRHRLDFLKGADEVRY